MEPVTRMLPKKAYSLKETVKYMRLNHSIDISEKDLIEYIQNGDIKVSIFIQGDSQSIDLINRKDLDADSIPVLGEKIVLHVDKTKFNMKITKTSGYGSISTKVDIKGEEFNIIVFLDPVRYGDYPSNCDIDTVSFLSFEDKPLRFVYEGYFPLKPKIFTYFNSEELLELGCIDEVEDILGYREGFHFRLPTDSNSFHLKLDDMCILHRDLLVFLDKFSTANQTQRVSELELRVKLLQEELIEKERIIAEFKDKATNSMSGKSTASENKKNEFIKALLKIKYGAEVAENPRPHVYDPNDSEKGKDGVIQRDFEVKGLTKHLPSGKTLKNWVSSVELEN